MIPSSYKQFDYGYAVTAHRSQGQSVDAVVIAGETMSRELFYVAARGRERLQTVITSDRARLEESVGVARAFRPPNSFDHARSRDRWPPARHFERVRARDPCGGGRGAPASEIEHDSHRYRSLRPSSSRASNTQLAPSEGDWNSSRNEDEVMESVGDAKP